MVDDLAWREYRDALSVEVGRVVALLRTLASEAASGHAVGDWDLVEVAVHLSHAWTILTGLAGREGAAIDALAPGRSTGPSVVASVEELGGFTTRAVAADPERNLAALATRIETMATSYLDNCLDDADPDAVRPWVVAGVEMPAPQFTAHLLSETAVHGWDIARAVGRTWRIEPATAGLVMGGFLLPLLLAGGPVLFSDRAALVAARGRYQFDVRGVYSQRLVLDEHGARADLDPGPPDCRISVDPVGFLLMFFGRRGPLATVVRGHLRPGGRKPWLALRLGTALPRP